MMENTGENVTIQVEEAFEEEKDSLREKKRQDAQSLSQLGNQYQSQNKFREAFDYYSKSKSAFEKIPDNQGAATQLKNMGNIKEILGEYADSQRYHEESKTLLKELGNKEEYYEVIDRIAKTYFKDKKLDEAVKEYQEAIDFGCRNGDLYNNMGFVQLYSKQYESAKKHLEEALELRTKEKSDFIDNTYNNLGAVAYLEQNYEQAKDLFMKALETNARKPREDRTIQFIVFANEKYRSEEIPSFECFSDVMTKASEHLNLAAAHTALKDKENAYRNCESAMLLDPDKPYLFLPSAWIYLSFEDNDRAIQYFKKVLSLARGASQIMRIVEEINPYIFMKIGRNEMCPCGSEKKFKKCHGKGL